MAENHKTEPPETVLEAAPQPDPLLARQQQLRQQLQQANAEISRLKDVLAATVSQADRIIGALGEISYQQNMNRETA